MASFTNYLSALAQRRDLVYKITTGVYGFPISKENGYLSITKNMKYAIVQHTGEERYECSCLTDYLYDSSVESCIHVKASKQFHQRYTTSGSVIQQTGPSKFTTLQPMSIDTTAIPPRSSILAALRRTQRQGKGKMPKLFL